MIGKIIMGVMVAVAIVVLACIKVGADYENSTT